MSTFGSTGQRGNGPFLLHMDNLPRKYTWQDLKDLVRTIAPHVQWTEMQVYPSGNPGGRGYARLQRKDEAFRLYRHLTENPIENRRLGVHLFDISIPDEKPVLLNCNTPTGLQARPPNFDPSYVMQAANSSGWGTLNIRSPPVATVQSSPYAASPIVAPIAAALPMHTQQLAQAMASLNMDARDPAQVHQFMCAHQARMQQLQYQQQLQQYQKYATNERGIPVNAAQGYVRTEARGIFVSGLNFKARKQDIERLFSKAGSIVRLELPKDPKTDKLKGNATIQYASVEEAQKAIRTFNGHKFMEMRLTVRTDFETTAITGQPPSTSSANAQSSAGASQPTIRTNNEPTIVNGSQVRQVQQA